MKTLNKNTPKLVSPIRVVCGDDAFVIDTEKRLIHCYYGEMPYELDTYGNMRLADAPYGLINYYGTEEGNSYAEAVIHAFNH